MVFMPKTRVVAEVGRLRARSNPFSCHQSCAFSLAVSAVKRLLNGNMLHAGKRNKVYSASASRALALISAVTQQA